MSEGASIVSWRGLMRDVSASGIFFETDAAYAIGSVIEVRLDLDTPWGKVKVESEGTIVRIEPYGRRVGVAVRFTDADAGAAHADSRRTRAAPKSSPRRGAGSKRGR